MLELFVQWREVCEGSTKDPASGCHKGDFNTLSPLQQSTHFGSEISDFGSKIQNEVNKLYENSAIPIPKSAIELFQYSKTARNAG